MIEKENNELLNEITSIFYEENKYVNYTLWLLLIGFTISLFFFLLRTITTLIDNICQEIIITDYSN